MKYKFLLISLISISLISLELVWTRIFSAEFFYTFAFLVLSVSILGLGLGALSLRLFKFMNKDIVFSIALLLTGVSAIVSPVLVFNLNPDFSLVFSDKMMWVKLALMFILLGSSFFFGGIAISKILKSNKDDIPKLYMSDMIGAGLGVLYAILCMNLWETPPAVGMSALPVFIAAFIVFRKYYKIIALLAITGLFFFNNNAYKYLKLEREERAKVIYTHWDAMSKIKLYKFADEYLGLNIDNIANSPVYAFDSNWDKPDSLKFQFGISVQHLIHQFDSCCFLSLGAGGGVDVLQALQEGATEVHAVEVNPHINYMMTEGNLKEFSGDVYHDKRVKVITEDARSYVRRFENKFDVIFSLSSNSWAALASGAFALSENYLFTKEAYEDYWKALSKKGFLMMEHQMYMPRLVSSALLALKDLGVENPKEHIAIYKLPQMRRHLLLMSKQKLTDSLRYNAILELKPEYFSYIHLVYPAADSLKDNLINKIVHNGWEKEQDSAKIDISPTFDDEPFVAQMGLWKNVKDAKFDKILPYEFYGFPLSQILILVIIGVVIAIVLPLNILPYFKKGEKLKAVPWLYFFAIGMGYMMIEIVMIQKYSLLIGAPIYSIITIMLTMLVFSGIGSKFSSKFNSKTIFGLIILLLLFDTFISTFIISWVDSCTFFIRLMITVILLAPLSFFMGMPFPKAGLRVGELIDWGFAVNGAASVLGSALVILISINLGFQMALLISGAIYLIAYVLFAMKNKSWKKNVILDNLNPN